jgi:hypothetical protein
MAERSGEHIVELLSSHLNAGIDGGGAAAAPCKRNIPAFRIPAANGVTMRQVFSGSRVDRNG